MENKTSIRQHALKLHKISLFPENIKLIFRDVFYMYMHRQT